MVKKSKKKQYLFKGLELDSQEELNFCYYLEELRQAKYISVWNRPSPIKMTNGLVVDYDDIEQLVTKTRVKEKRQILLRESEYTPDFTIVWNKKAKDIFVTELSESILLREKIKTPFVCDVTNLSHVEIKPSLTFDPNNMLRLFRLNQKFMWHTHKIYVNLAIPTELFIETFTPLDVKIPIDRKTRQTKWDKRTLKQYIDGIK